MFHRCLIPGLLVSCLAPVATAQTITDNRLRLQTWASGLDSPTTFAWVGEGELLVFEKDTGKVRRVKNGKVKNIALDLNVAHDAERGGLGIAVDADFVHNQYVYLYYSVTSSGGDSIGNWTENRVERFSFDGTKLSNGSGPLASFALDAGQTGNGPNHDGGVIRFGPDGKLYGVTGDLNRGRFGSTARVEQNTAATGSARVGGVFRINPDGSIPADNPFINESDANFHIWYSYGLRNSYGMAFDPLTSVLWYTENGPDKYDEINRCPPGMNGGWLLIMGPDSRNAGYSENGNTSYDASQLAYLGGATYVDPEFSFKTPNGITAIQFIHSKRFPNDLRDNVYVGDNNTGSLYYFELKKQRDEFVLKGGLTDKVADNSSEVAKVVAGSGFSCLTDIQIGSDGYVYMTNLNSGQIFRIRPVVDLLEPSALDVRIGTQTSGTLLETEESDDAYLRIAADGTSPRPDSIVADFSFVLNEKAPASVTIDVETRCDGVGNESLLAHNQVTGLWDRVDLRATGPIDVLRTLALTNSADYVRAIDRVLELRLEVDVVGTSTVTSGPGPTFSGQPSLPSGQPTRPGQPGTSSQPIPPKFRVWIDQLRLNVTYP